MSDNTFIPVPLPGDPIPEEVVEQPIVEQVVIEGVQPEDGRPKGSDYIPEHVQYLKRFSELLSSELSEVTDMVRLMSKDLDNYTRGEITMEEIKTTCPEFVIETDSPPVYEVYNYIRSSLISSYEKEFGEK